MVTWKWREIFVLNALQLVSTNGFSGRVITEMASCVIGEEECVPVQAVTELVTLNLRELWGSPGYGELKRYLWSLCLWNRKYELRCKPWSYQRVQHHGQIHCSSTHYNLLTYEPYLSFLNFNSFKKEYSYRLF